ncbi:MAG: hypothetical protein RLZZ45_716, partial [Bacteroidota bacterium]
MSIRNLLNGIVALVSIVSLSNCTKIKGTDIGLGLLPAIDN